jgi:16S rRNA (guanine527-N7)-methyltransferase
VSGSRAGTAIAALVARHPLPIGAEPRLTAFAELLARDRQAPTTIREPGRVIDEHLADALVALDLPQVKRAVAIADLGSGAGVPGLPLAIALPDAHITLVESSAPKCRFLQRAVSASRVSNVTVEHVRAEAWLDGLGRHDLITARALGPLPVVAEYAAPLLRIGGAVVVWRGERDAAAEAAAAEAASALGLEPAPPLAVHPYADARNRHLHLMTKVASTPARFPRRPGVARRRPLGGQSGSRRARDTTPPTV